ncbi:DsrE family protein [Desulfosediminicola sp.]|uniref:DsrE family protein n=1 Tax=Desulfosediminicola sp. TaxID=2886825 RepID=UPI003AF202DF
MKCIRAFNVFIASCVLMFLVNGVAVAGDVNDQDALSGLTETKTLFDINVSEASKLALYLDVINMTYDDLLRQGRTADFVIAFRGASVRLVTTENWSFSDQDQELLKKSAKLLAELQKRGVKIEACAIAINLFKVDADTLLDGVKVVGNTFVSLTGYQNKGYALVPIQ